MNLFCNVRTRAFTSFIACAFSVHTGSKNAQNVQMNMNLLFLKWFWKIKLTEFNWENGEMICFLEVFFLIFTALLAQCELKKSYMF